MNEIYIITLDWEGYDEGSDNTYAHQDFVAWFASMPTREQVMALGFDVEQAERILRGGGRVGNEYNWYSLHTAREGVDHSPDAVPLIPVEGANIAKTISGLEAANEAYRKETLAALSEYQACPNPLTTGAVQFKARMKVAKAELDAATDAFLAANDNA